MFMTRVDLNTEAPDFILKDFEGNTVSAVTRLSACVKTQFKRDTVHFTVRIDQPQSKNSSNSLC